MTLQPYNLVDRLRLTSLQTWHVQRANGGFYRDDLPFEAADRIEELERACAEFAAARASALSHDDLCLLSRIFNAHSTIHVNDYTRINGWLKDAIAKALGGAS